MANNAYYIELIEKEFRDARDARQRGIEGRARVCARRAAGFAVAWLCQSRGLQVRESDSMNLLKGMQEDASLTQDVREASKRLTARIRPDFTYASPTDPLDDARIIVDYVKQLFA